MSGIILIVENDFEWAETILGYYLSKMNFTHQIALDVRTAKRIIDQNEISLVTVDMDLGGGTATGEIILDYLMQKSENSRCIIISGSDLGNESTFSIAKRFPNADAYLVKNPFDSDKFQTLVKKIMGENGIESAKDVVVSTVPKPHLQKIRRLMTQHFSEDEVRDICFDLNVEYENLGGMGKNNKIRQLITHSIHLNIFSQLVTLCREQRPKIDWPEIN